MAATNVNLGIILLLAPLAAVPRGRPLAEGVAGVLDRTTLEDARLAYQAIRLANPGGLGRSPEGEDVADEPTGTLLEVMRLAEGRDRDRPPVRPSVRRTSSTIVLPALEAGLARGWPLEAAIVGAALRVLAARPDTLIARKRGDAVAAEASGRAAAVLASAWPDRVEEFDRFDAWLRVDGHARNPGATADLVTAGLFAGLRDGTISLLTDRPWSGPTPAG